MPMPSHQPEPGLKPMADFEEEDPLHSLAGDIGVVPDPPAPVGLRLTEAGVRALLNRPKVPRAKPLLELTCVGCGRTTFHKCRFVRCDYLELGAE